MPPQAPRSANCPIAADCSLGGVPDGANRWRFSFRFAGNQRTLALGVFPEVTLADARGISRAQAT